MGSWRQWPHWDVMLLTPSERKARGSKAAAGPSQQAKSRRAGAVKTSQRLTGSACYLAISWCIPSPLSRTCASNAHYATTIDTMQWHATDRLSVLTFPLQERIRHRLLLPANGRRRWYGRAHGRRLRHTLAVNPSLRFLLIREGCFTARHSRFDGSIQTPGRLRELCGFCVFHINIFAAQPWPCCLAAGVHCWTLFVVCDAILEAVCDALHLRAVGVEWFDGWLWLCSLLGTLRSVGRASRQ
jgi:hypothetical protein